MNTFSQMFRNVMEIAIVVSLRKKVVLLINVKVNISSSLEPSVPFYSLVNMVNSEDITLETIQTRELSLEINNLFETLQKNALLYKHLLILLKYMLCTLTGNLNLILKTNFSFVIKTIFHYLDAIVV